MSALVGFTGVQKMRTAQIQMDPSRANANKDMEILGITQANFAMVSVFSSTTAQLEC